MPCFMEDPGQELDSAHNDEDYARQQKTTKAVDSKQWMPSV